MIARDTMPRRQGRRLARVVISLVLGVLLSASLPGCGSTAKRPLVVEDALVDPHAGRRTLAVAEVGRQRDVTRIPALIEMLDDDDPAVRMAAGATLRDLTGRDTGYEPWAPPEIRRQQVLVWRSWWQAEGRSRYGATATATAAPPPPAPSPARIIGGRGT